MCDPINDVELYLRTAEESEFQIRYVIDIHLHAACVRATNQGVVAPLDPALAKRG